MANKKRKSFLDLLNIKSKRKVEVPEPKKVNFQENDNNYKERLDNEHLQKMEAKEPLESSEWLAKAAEDGQLTLDVYQTDKDIIIKSTIAGVKPEDLDISYNNGMVTIKGERKGEEKIDQQNYFYQELYWGGFSRSVILPTDIDEDNIQAELKNGILTVKLPKKEEKHKKKIEVKTT
jgi:HSP20 family protein